VVAVSDDEGERADADVAEAPKEVADASSGNDRADSQAPDMDPDDADTAEDAPERDPTDDAATSEADDDTRDLVRYARYALLGGLTLLALVATLRLYFAVSSAIDIWVAREYRPLFQAAFNLVVLLLAAIGISWEVRKVAG
jgi:hypothetical protein